MKRLVFLGVCLLCSAVYATDPPKSAPHTSSADADAAAAAHAAAGASVGPVTTGPSSAATGPVTATAANQGVNAGSAYTSDFDSWALSLPQGAPGAPELGINECMEALPTTNVLGSGRGGATQLDEACMTKRYCLALASFYRDGGRMDLAVAKLASPECGGAPESEPTISTSDCYQRQENIEQVALECVQK